MTTRSALLRRPRGLLAVLVLVPVLLLALQGMTFQASAASLDWVDGGDDQLCLQDDNGVALAHPEIEQCAPIIGCETGESGGRPWIRFPTKNGVWQPKEAYKNYLVLYGDEQPPAATPTTSPTPTAGASPTTPGTATPTAPAASGSAKPPQTSPTKPATPTKPAKPGQSPSKPGTSPTAAPSGGATSAPVASDAEDLGLDEDAEVAAGAPTAPAAPTVTVDGSDVTVTWEANADAELEGVTGYVVRFSGADPVETDAATTSYTFEDLADGNYRAAVRAVNDAGESPSSPPSDIATVGTPIADVKGALTVDGDLSAGATVTISGAGYAPNVPELVLELHSTPVQIGAVATDQTGAFSTTVTLPADVEAGEHHLVVLYDGAEVTSTAVQVAAAAPVDAAAGDTADLGAAAEPAEAVPPVTGVVILVALAGLGFAALGWHVLGGRRRRGARAGIPAQAAPVAPPLAHAGLSGTTTEVIGSAR